MSSHWSLQIRMYAALLAKDHLIAAHHRSEQSLWYSEDGLIRKRFVAQSYDAHGYQVTRELPLRLGDNWHLVFELKQKGRGLSQTHFITVFQHIVESVISRSPKG